MSRPALLRLMSSFTYSRQTPMRTNDSLNRSYDQIVEVLLSGAVSRMFSDFANKFLLQAVSLDLALISARVKFNMSRVKKKFSVLSVLLSLEFLSLGVFINGNFSWSNQHPSPSLKTASYMDGKAVKLDSPAKTEGLFVERYGELTPRSGEFLTAKKNAGVSHRSFIVVALFSASI